MPNLLHVAFGLHPWMSSDLLNSGSVLAIVTEESQDEVLEWLGQALSTGLFPVSGVVTLEEKVVEILVFFGFFEWEDALHDDEQDDACGEHVDLGAIVVLALLNLWCHVCHGSSVRLEIVDFPEGGEAEICNLEIHVVIDEDVFKFQISVNDTLSMHVLEHIAHLVEEETAAVLAHAAERLAQVEEQTASDELEENIDQIANFSTGRFNDTTI